MEGYKELVEKLEGLVASLENGELSLDQLTELEAVTRKLHERSIILRYKAFESSVLGDTVVEEPEIVTKEIVSEIEPDPIPELEPEVEEEKAFDFAIFDTEESEESAEEEENDVEPSEPEEVTSDPIETAAPEPIAEIEEEEITPIQKEVAPEPIVEETSSSPVASAASASSFLDKLGQHDNSTSGRFAAPLDSLIGAFGLNERLRFINDLFDGSSEKFSDAIKALDSQSGLDSARMKAAAYAEENEWDAEEEVVVEFMNYVSRRYA